MFLVFIYNPIIDLVRYQKIPENLWVGDNVNNLSKLFYLKCLTILHKILMILKRLIT